MNEQLAMMIGMVGGLALGLITFLIGKSGGYASGWKAVMETAEYLGAFDGDANCVEGEQNV